MFKYSVLLLVTLIYSFTGVSQIEQVVNLGEPGTTHFGGDVYIDDDGNHVLLLLDIDKGTRLAYVNAAYTPIWVHDLDLMTSGSVGRRGKGESLSAPSNSSSVARAPLFTNPKRDGPSTGDRRAREHYAEVSTALHRFVAARDRTNTLEVGARGKPRRL